MIDRFQFDTDFVIINHSTVMRFSCIVFLLLTYGYVASRFSSNDIFIERYVDLVNVYFKLRHVSVVTQFTCFSTSKLNNNAIF